MSNTKIEWATKVWNPLRGCTKVSEGCRNCYAIRQAHRFSGEGMPYEGLTAKTAAGVNWTGKVMLVPDMLDAPLEWKKSERIFVNSMSDLFHENVPFEYIDQVFAVMALASRHIFQVLTKRPQRMLEWFNSVQSRRPIPGRGVSTGQSPFCIGDGCYLHDSDVGYCGSPWPLPNVWLGTSVENQKAADERVPHLLQTPAAVRFLSCEPLLGYVDLFSAFSYHDVLIHPKQIAEKLHWIIVGGESDPGARPMHPEWARSLRDQCQAAEVPFFFKQWGEHVVPSQMERELYYAIENHGAGIGIGDAYRRVGKKRAGRSLDGREWNEYPNEPR